MSYLNSYIRYAKRLRNPDRKSFRLIFKYIRVNHFTNVCFSQIDFTQNDTNTIHVNSTDFDGNLPLFRLISRLPNTY